MSDDVCDHLCEPPPLCKHHIPCFKCSRKTAGRCGSCKRACCSDHIEWVFGKPHCGIGCPGSKAEKIEPKKSIYANRFLIEAPIVETYEGGPNFQRTVFHPDFSKAKPPLPAKKPNEKRKIKLVREFVNESGRSALYEVIVE